MDTNTKSKSSGTPGTQPMAYTFGSLFMDMYRAGCAPCEKIEKDLVAFEKKGDYNGFNG